MNGEAFKTISIASEYLLFRRFVNLMVDREVSLCVKFKGYVDACLALGARFYGHIVFPKQSVLFDPLAVALVDFHLEAFLTVKRIRIPFKDLARIGGTSWNYDSHHSVLHFYANVRKHGTFFCWLIILN